MMRIAFMALCGWLAVSPAWAASYCDSRGNSSHEWVEGVVVNGMVRVSPANTGYLDGTAGKPFELTGNGDRLEVRPGYSSSSYPENWAAWIDFNQNGVFDTAERVLTAQGIGAQSSVIALPASVPSGTTRMRVQMRWGGNPQPCGNYSYGETEDYLVKFPGPSTPAYPYSLELQPEFWVVRSGDLGDKLTLVVQKNNQTVLERNAASKLRDHYWSNTTGSRYKLWLKAFVNGAYQQVSNAVEYRPGTTDSVSLTRLSNGLIQPSQSFVGDWVVERNGVVVARQPAQPGVPLQYSFQYGDRYQVWAEAVVNGSREAIAIPLAFREGFPSPYIDLEVEADFRLRHNGPLDQPLSWTIQEDGVQVYQQPTSGASSLSYPFQIGRKYKVWLEQAVGAELVRVSDAEYFTPGVSDKYQVGVDASRLLTRSGELGESLTWVIEEAGDVVLERNASNELSYTYSNFDPAKPYRVWLTKFMDGYYQRVSNVVRYGAGSEPVSPIEQFQLTVDANHTLIRSAGTAQSLQWVIEEEGRIVLERWAENELSYTYFAYSPGKTYRTWLKSFIDGAYQRVSNVVSY